MRWVSTHLPGDRIIHGLERRIRHQAVLADGLVARFTSVVISVLSYPACVWADTTWTPLKAIGVYDFN
jgi:hypothetical protein